jgi:hypothetical protein
MWPNLAKNAPLAAVVAVDQAVRVVAVAASATDFGFHGWVRPMPDPAFLCR